MAETGKSFVKKFVGFSVVTWISFLSSTYKCNFLGADNKQ